MAQVKTSIVLELTDKLSPSLKKITKATEKLTFAGSKFTKSLEMQSSRMTKTIRLLNSYAGRMRLVARETKKLQNLNKNFSQQKGSILGLLAMGASMIAPLSVTRQRELMGARLKTVLPNENRNENLGSSEKSARGFARTGLSSYQELINAEYNLLSAGIDVESSRKGAIIAAKVAKVTGGNAGEVAQTLATVANNFEASIEKIGDLATKTQLKFQIKDFNQLNETMKNLTGSALAMKMSEEDAFAFGGMLNSSGLAGSMGGTAGSAILKEVVSASEKLGIVWDGDIVKFMETLEDKLDGMSDNDKYKAISKIFSGEEAIKAISLLLPKTKQMKDNFADVRNNSKGTMDKELLEFTELLDTNLKKLFESVANLQIVLGVLYYLWLCL